MSANQRRRLLGSLLLVLVPLLAVPALPAAAANGDRYTFSGRGWGHGVGMSQYGAYGQALDGRSYQQILAQYYRGTEVASISEVVAADSFLRTQTEPVWIGILQSQTSVTFEPVAIKSTHQIDVCQVKFDGTTRCATAQVGETWKVKTAKGGGCKVYRDDAVAWKGRGECIVDVTWEGSPTRILVPTTGFTYARGSLRFRPVPGSATFHLSVQLSIDAYVKGIAEVPTAWPDAVLQAQAVAARSYGAYKILAYGNISALSETRQQECWCHLYGDTRDQYYIGWDKETVGPEWPDAVVDTSGKVVTYDGDGTQSGIIQAFYSSSSGGVTERSVDIWGGWRDYLQSEDDHWAIESQVNNPAASWTFELTGGEIASALGWDEVTNVTLLTTPPNSTFEVEGEDGGAAVSTTVTGPWIYQTFGTKSPHVRAVSVERLGPFDDIAGSTHEEAILAIAEEGITEGCDVDSYCPSATVTRAQMASFLARALDLPGAEGNRFGDVVPGSTHAANINAIADAGITLGCNEAGTRFCPEESVTRAQMASFLVRALELTPIDLGTFVDVPDSSPHQENIDALYEAGITLGCDAEGPRFCPSKPLPRDEMASFLARAFIWR